MLAITKLLANVNKHHGLALQSHFLVSMPILPNVRANLDSESLSLFCKSAVLPGVNLQTAEVTHTGYGNSEKRPYKASFSDAQLVFLLDSETHVAEYIESWLHLISNFRGDQDGGTSNRDTFEYPADYWTDITITQYDEVGKKTKSYKLLKAFPVATGDVTLDWETGQPILFPVSFAYHSWTSDKLIKE